MPGDGIDPCLHTAMAYAATLGMDLAARSDINSPRLLWSQASECYLAQLHVQTNDSADSHFVAYLVAAVGWYLAYPGRKVPKMKTPDLTRKQTPKVFKRLFPSAQQTTLGAVFELPYTPVCIWSMATSPTLEDMLLELYHDRVITKKECSEFVS